MNTQDESLLDIPSFLRRDAGEVKPTRTRKRRLVIPKRKPIKRASQKQIRQLIGLGYNPTTAKMKRREDAASIIQFSVPPTPKPIQLKRPGQ